MQGVKRAEGQYTATVTYFTFTTTAASLPDSRARARSMEKRGKKKSEKQSIDRHSRQEAAVVKRAQVFSHKGILVLDYRTESSKKGHSMHKVSVMKKKKKKQR